MNIEVAEEVFLLVILAVHDSSDMPLLIQGQGFRTVVLDSSEHSQ